MCRDPEMQQNKTKTNKNTGENVNMFCNPQMKDKDGTKRNITIETRT